MKFHFMTVFDVTTAIPYISTVKEPTEKVIVYADV